MVFPFSNSLAFGPTVPQGGMPCAVDADVDLPYTAEPHEVWMDEVAVTSPS